MNHNPHNIKIGDTVIADEKFRGGYQVIVSALTPNGMFATIAVPDDPDGHWEIMTNRLTPIIKSE